MRPASERIVIEAPFSFTGSAKRLWRLSRNPWVRALVLVPTIIIAWMGVLAWYSLFGLWVVPYRLIRRSQRKQRVEAARQRELLGALSGKAPS